MPAAHSKFVGYFSAVLSLACLGAGYANAQGPADAQAYDPPSRVARLNYASGNVSMQPAGVNDWAPAEINHPFTVGDILYSDVNSMAELHTDVAVMRLGSQASLNFLNLSDSIIQIKATSGDISFRLHDLGPNQVFEVDTPNAAVQLVRDGVYRFRISGDGSMSFLVVRSGEAQVTAGAQTFALDPGNSVQVEGTDQASIDVQTAPAPDQFDNWCSGRDEQEARLAATRYLPPTVIGGEDLGEYGDWQQAPEYGAVWYPRSVPADWAPYHVGHWAWVEPWGWTWVDAAPWGFAPFHYGRWAYIGSRWGWCPGPIAVGYRGPVVRAYYAPALVAWFGGAHWGVSVAAGGGPSLGWVPLGFGEVFTPAYRCSRPYFSNVNVYNTRVVKTVNITNVYNTVYVNKTTYNQTFINTRAPNAIAAMRQDAFASGRPVRGNGLALRPDQLRQVQGGTILAPGVAPAREAVVYNNSNRAVARPNAQVINRPVVAVRSPGVVPAPFAARQQYMQSHAGDVHDFAAMHQQVAARNSAVPAPAQQVVQVRPAAEVRPARVQPGEHFGGTLQGSTPQAPRSQPASVVPQPVTPAARPQPGYQRPQPAAQPQPVTPATRPQPVTPAARPQPAYQRPEPFPRPLAPAPAARVPQPAAAAPVPQTPAPPSRPVQRPEPSYQARPSAPPVREQQQPEVRRPEPPPPTRETAAPTRSSPESRPQQPAREEHHAAPPNEHPAPQKAQPEHKEPDKKPADHKSQ